MRIPDWIKDLFKQADCINHNGFIEQNEIDKVKNDKYSIFFYSEYCPYKIEAGMNYINFIDANMDYFREGIQFTDKKYTEGRFLVVDGELKPAGTRNKSQDSLNSLEVRQGEYAVASYTKDTPQLQTFNVSSCVVVTIYDKKHKKGFMAHLDTIPCTESLDNTLKKMKFNPNDCEVRLIGGCYGTEGKIELIEEILQKYNMNIVEYDILGDKDRHIQMDLQTGEVTDYVESIPKPISERNTDEMMVTERKNGALVRNKNSK